MTFVRNRHLARELERSPRFKLAMRQAAEAVEQTVERFVPPGGPGRGMRERVRTFQDKDGVGVEIDDPFAHLAEWGSRNNPPYAPLRRGVRAAGLRLEETQGK